MSQPINRALVRSLARLHTVTQLYVKLDAATAELEQAYSDQVVVTGGNMKESGTSGEFIKGNLDREVRTIEAAISLRKRIDAGASNGGPNRRMNHVNFSYRVVSF
jgi:hypothetical protein